ncbi:hypothetical protein OROHE_012592 [Orobanche hederae]
MGFWASSNRLGALGTDDVRALIQLGLGGPWSTWSSGDLCDGEQLPIQVSGKALSYGRRVWRRGSACRASVDDGKFKFPVASRACTQMECNSSKISGDSSMPDECMTRGVGVDQDDLSVSDVSVVNCHGREVMCKGKKYVFISEHVDPVGCPTGVISLSPPSSLCEGALSAIKALYSLPKSVRLPYKRERVDWKIDGWICFYEIAFEIVFRLPLIPFVMEVLAHYGCAPNQLMPNAWRLLLGLQYLGEAKGISISNGTLQRTYYPKQHDSEMGRLQLNLRPEKQPLINIPSKIDFCSWKGRYFCMESKYVFRPGGSGGIPTHWVGIYGSRDRVPSTDPLGESSSTSSFVEAFMEGSKKHKIFTAKEMYAMARKKTKKVDSRSIVPSPNAEIGDPSNMSRGALIERASKVFLGEPEGDVSNIVMGEKAHLYMGTSAFNGNTGSLSLDDEVRKMGASEASTYAFSHLIKQHKQCSYLIKILSLQKRDRPYNLLVMPLSRKKKLELSLRKEKKRSSDSEQHSKARVAYLEARLEEQTTQVKADRAMSKKIQIRAIAQTRRDLMMEFMNGEHVKWAALKKVQMCEDILNAADGDEDAE